MAIDGTNNLRLNVTKDDVQSSLNGDCIEENLNDNDRVYSCFCNTDLCNTGRMNACQIFMIFYVMFFKIGIDIMRKLLN